MSAEAETRLAIHVDGASADEIRRGVAAAEAVFNNAGVTAQEAAAAFRKREAEKEALTERENANATLWLDADRAAAQACCAVWSTWFKSVDTANLKIVR